MLARRSGTVLAIVVARRSERSSRLRQIAHPFGSVIAPYRNALEEPSVKKLSSDPSGSPRGYDLAARNRRGPSLRNYSGDPL